MRIPAVYTVTGVVSCRYLCRDRRDLTSLLHSLELYYYIMLLPHGYGFSLSSVQHCSWVPASWAKPHEFVASELWWGEQGRDGFQGEKGQRCSISIYASLQDLGFCFQIYCKPVVSYQMEYQSSLSIYPSVNNNVGENRRIWEIVPVKTAVFQKETLTCSHILVC